MALCKHRFIQKIYKAGLNGSSQFVWNLVKKSSVLLIYCRQEHKNCSPPLFTQPGKSLLVQPSKLSQGDKSWKEHMFHKLVASQVYLHKEKNYFLMLS